jgi:peptidoglycan/LPS O-acetylase OafA/YrhL
MSNKVAAEGKSVRRYDLDWLRVIGTLLIFAYHSAAPFHPWFDWHIRNTQKSEPLGWFSAAMYSWPLPLFMLLAGAGTWFALRKRSYWQYGWERFTRLLLPTIFGLIILIPPQVYMERVQRHQFAGSFLEFVPHAFEGGPYPQGNISAGQLWFLVYLFIYSVVALPLFRFLKGGIGQRWTSWLAAFCQRRGAIFLFAIPLIIGQIILGWRYPETHNLVRDWMWHWVLFSAFIFGFVLSSDERFGRVLEREWGLGLALAVASSVGMLILLNTNPTIVTDSVLGFGPTFALGTFKSQLLYALGCAALRLNTWAWLVVIMALARRYMSSTSTFLAYASRASYTVYMLHQTIIIIVAFYVVKWQVGLTAKFLAILLPSFAITMVMYELIRRWSVTRFLFGLKGTRKPKTLSASMAAAREG